MRCEERPHGIGSPDPTPFFDNQRLQTQIGPDLIRACMHTRHALTFRTGVRWIGKYETRFTTLTMSVKAVASFSLSEPSHRYRTRATRTQPPRSPALRACDRQDLSMWILCSSLCCLRCLLHGFTADTLIESFGIVGGRGRGVARRHTRYSPALSPKPSP